MSFKRNKQTTVQWHHWLRLNEDRLRACGVPTFYFKSLQDWWSFLDHGYYTPFGHSEPVIDVDDLPAEQALELCLFLEGEERGEEPSGALNRLQYLLSRGRHGDSGESESD